MFRMAVEEGLIAASPVANRAANPPTLDEVRDAATPRKVWDSSELSLFLSWAHENSTYWPLWETAAGTGMRRGELCGLKWGDVDLHENMPHVVHSLAQVKTKGAGYKLVEKGTKSSKPRSITFGPRVRKALLEQRRRAAAGGLGNVRDNKPVFTTRRLKPWIPDSMTRSWEDTVDVFTVAHPNVEPITLQGLRHTHATILIMELNTSVKAVQERLGHSDVSTTLRVYTHVGRDRHQRIADDFERLIVG